MKFQIITDASCDLPASRLEELGVVSIPGIVYIGERDFLDHESLTPENIKDLTAKDNHIKLYEASETLFYNCLKQWAQTDEELIYIGTSKSLYNGIEKALSVKKMLLEEFPNFKMTIIDSRTLSIGQGLLIEWVCQHLSEVTDKASLLDLIKVGILRLHQYCLVGQLDNLHRNGFLATSLYMSAKMLGICPILEFDHKGKIEVKEKCKGLAKGLDKLVQIFLENVQNPKQSKVAIGYIGDEALAQSLKNKLTLLGVKDISLYQAGALMGHYLGYQSIGLVFMDN